VTSDNRLGVEIQRIRERLRTMRAEREAAMSKLAESREHAEAQRQGRSDPEAARDDALYAP
jgi:hypothetical protein